MSFADYDNARWHVDSAERFRVCLPADWRLQPSGDPDSFWVMSAGPGPGSIRLALLRGGADGVWGGEVVRAAAETRSGVRVVEQDGAVHAAYVRRVATPFGEDLQYLWEIGSGAWVALWSYLIDGRLRTSPGVALEFQAVSFIIGSFRFLAAAVEG